MHKVRIAGALLMVVISSFASCAGATALAREVTEETLGRAISEAENALTEVTTDKLTEHKKYLQNLVDQARGMMLCFVCNQDKNLEELESALEEGAEVLLLMNRSEALPKVTQEETKEERLIADVVVSQNNQARAEMAPEVVTNGQIVVAAEQSSDISRIDEVEASTDEETETQNEIEELDTEVIEVPATGASEESNGMTVLMLGGIVVALAGVTSIVLVKRMKR